VAQVGASQAVVEVESFMRPAGADAEVGEELTTTAGMADAAGRSGRRRVHHPVLRRGTVG
jgi:hypothetical protein